VCLSSDGTGEDISQVGRVLREVLVGLGKGGWVSVPSENGHGERVHSTSQRPVHPRVPQHIVTVAVAELFLERGEATVHCVSRSSAAPSISENPPFWMSEHEPLGDFKRFCGAVNDPGDAGLGFGLGKHPAVIYQVDVSGFYAKRLLRSAACLPGRDKQVPKRPVAGDFENSVELNLGHDEFALACGRFLHVRDRGAVDVALLLGPAPGPLDGPAIVSLRAIGQVLVAVDPLLDVKRSKLRGLELAGNEADEALQAEPVPFVGVRRSVLLAPVKKGIDDGGAALASTFLARGWAIS